DPAGPDALEPIGRAHRLERARGEDRGRVDREAPRYASVEQLTELRRCERVPNLVEWVHADVHAVPGEQLPLVRVDEVAVREQEIGSESVRGREHFDLADPLDLVTGSRAVHRDRKAERARLGEFALPDRNGRPCRAPQPYTEGQERVTPARA